MLNLDHFSLIYINTTHSGNLGSIARAAKNMGIKDIRLVTPKASIQDPEAIANAAGATDYLQQMQIFNSLDQALADCNLIFGTSARNRALNPITIAPSQISKCILESIRATINLDKTKIAILFGTEKSGLTNDELLLSNYHIVIDANPEYTSLNLAMATLLVCYEIRMQIIQLANHSNYNPNGFSSLTISESKNNGIEQSRTNTTITITDGDKENQELASQDDYNAYFKRMEAYYSQIGFIQHNMVIPRLWHLYKRANLSKKEIDLLQGMLTAIIKKSDKP